MWKLKWLLCLEVLTLQTSSERTSTSFALRKSGFHRDLEYSVRLLNVSGNCDISIVQVLPSNVFTNTDQLDDLKRLGKINSYTPVYSDVEATEKDSHPSEIFLFDNLKDTLNFTLPIHFRYHDPGDTGFRKVQIFPPDVFANCEIDGLTLPELKTFEFPCYNGSLKENFNQALDVDVCVWKQLDIHFSESLTTYIPIGNKRLSLFVTVITLIISWISCLYIVITLYKKPA